MAKHTVTEAAKLAGCSRSYFYKKYIRSGIVSVERDQEGNPLIDTSEILRVSGSLHGEAHQDTPENTVDHTAELRLLREQLAQAGAREHWLQGKVDQLSDQLAATVRLIEHQSQTPPPKEAKPKTPWWRYSGLY